MISDHVVRSLLLAQGGFTLGMTIIIVVRHAKIFGQNRKIRHMLLPWHIVSIGLSHALMVVYIVEATIERIGEPLTHRTFIAFLAFLLSNAALVIIATWQKRRGGPKKSIEKR